MIQKRKQREFRAITLQGAIEKRPILQKLPFLKSTKIISYFGGTNNEILLIFYLL